MSMTEEVIRVEWKAAGKTNFTDMKFMDGKWWKLNKKQQWVQCFSVDDRRRDKFIAEKSMATLFDQPQFKVLEAKVAELEAMVSPPSAENLLETLDVNADTVLRPDYLHPNAESILGSKLPPYKVIGRPEIGGDRHYLYAIPNPDRKSNRSWLIQKPLPGVTSILKKTMPTPPQLVKWMATFPGGYEAAREHTDLMAKRGTIMHGMFADFVNGLVPEFDSTEWHEYISVKMRKQKVDKKHHGEWQHFMKKALLSLMQWMEDYEVTILLMEVALVSDKLGYAGQVDVICEMNERIYTKPIVEVFPIKKAKASHPKRQTKAVALETAGQLKRHWNVEPAGVPASALYGAGDASEMGFSRREPNMDNILENKVFNPRRRVNAIVDFKSGEHNSDSHSVQLSMYVPLIQEAFPNFRIEKAWNWHPTNWRERPNKAGEWNFSYNAIDQTNNLSLEDANLLIARYNLKFRKEMESVVKFEGKPILGVKPASLVNTVGFVEHWESTLHLAMDLGLEMD